MNGNIKVLLLVMLTLSWMLYPPTVASAAVGAKTIDNPVPGHYLSAADADWRGTVKQEHYTVSSGRHQGLTKYIYVYLPAEYDKAENAFKQYDVFYFMHGLGGTAYELLGEQFNDGQIKNMLDHMIADKKIDPMIVVAVTWNTNANLSGPNSSVISSQGGDAERQAFHTEFEEDVMPLIETKYRTYAGLAVRENVEADTPSQIPIVQNANDAVSIDEALRQSRRHRGFGGFSYGAHTTWYQLRSDVDYIYYFAPMSGGLTNLFSEIASHRHDYELCCITGTSDVTSGQCDTMMNLYRDGDADSLSYYKINGATHSYPGYRQYLYTALMELYRTDKGESWTVGMERSGGGSTSTGGRVETGGSDDKPSGDRESNSGEKPSESGGSNTSDSSAKEGEAEESDSSSESRESEESGSSSESRESGASNGSVEDDGSHKAAQSIDTSKAIKPATDHRTQRISTAKPKSNVIVSGRSTKIDVKGTDLKGKTVYSSSNPKIAKVNSAGEITGLAAGKTTIKVYVKASGHYTQSNTVSFKVSVKAPAKTKITSVASKTSKKVVVKWKKTTCNGYVLEYATNKKFTKNPKTLSLKGTGTTTKTIGGLKKGVTYYVRVYAYGSSPGVKSAASAVKSVRCR